MYLYAQSNWLCVYFRFETRSSESCYFKIDRRNSYEIYSVLFKLNSFWFFNKNATDGHSVQIQGDSSGHRGI